MRLIRTSPGHYETEDGEYVIECESRSALPWGVFKDGDMLGDAKTKGEAVGILKWHLRKVKTDV